MGNIRIRYHPVFLNVYYLLRVSTITFASLGQEPITLYYLPFASVSQLSAHVNDYLHLQAVSTQGLPIFLLLSGSKRFPEGR
jgi:hypothetical protein